MTKLISESDGRTFRLFFIDEFSGPRGTGSPARSLMQFLWVIVVNRHTGRSSTPTFSARGKRSKWKTVKISRTRRYVEARSQTQRAGDGEATKGDGYPSVARASITSQWRNQRRVIFIFNGRDRPDTFEQPGTTISRKRDNTAAEVRYNRV